MFNQYLKHSRTTILFVMMLGALLLCQFFFPVKFLTLSNFQSIASQIPEFKLLAIAIMLADADRGIDLSIISTANLAGVGAALILTKYSSQLRAYEEVISNFFSNSLSDRHILLCGLINGLLIAYIKVPAILATLGTMSIFSGIAIVINQRIWYSGIPGKISIYWKWHDPCHSHADDYFYCLYPIDVFNPEPNLLRFNLYMLGSNPVASRFSGINNRGILVRTYILSGLCSGLASIIMISR